MKLARASLSNLIDQVYWIKHMQFTTKMTDKWSEFFALNID